MKLDRHGWWVPWNKEVGKDLTCKPQSTSDYPNPPSFKAYRRAQGAKEALVPYFWALEKYGKRPQDTRPQPHKISLNFNGKMRKETQQDEALRLGLEAMRTKGGGVLSLPPGYGKVCPQ